MDSIELAEAAVERDKAAVVAAFGLVSRKAEGALGSPLVLGGALLGAVLVGYLAAGRTGNKRRATGTWSLALQIARFLIPLVRRSASPRGGMAPPSASSVPDRGGDPGPRKMNLKGMELVKESAWVDDYAPSMGAAISYYTLFSISYRMSAAKVQLYIRRCDNEVSGLRRSSLTRQSERGH